MSEESEQEAGKRNPFRRLAEGGRVHRFGGGGGYLRSRIPGVGLPWADEWSILSGTNRPRGDHVQAIRDRPGLERFSFRLSGIAPE